MDDIDFVPHDWVPHNGWPFTKAHLDQYSARAQAICQLGPYKYDVEAWQDDAAPPLAFSSRRIKTHIFQISLPARFGQVYRRAIFESRNIGTYLYGNVEKIETNDVGRQTTGVRVATLRGTRFRVAARVVVLAAGGIESPRLLLLSDRVNTCGLGNEHDLVGRFFADHLRIEWQASTCRRIKRRLKSRALLGRPTPYPAGCGTLASPAEHANAYARPHRRDTQLVELMNMSRCAQVARSLAACPWTDRSRLWSLGLLVAASLVFGAINDAAAAQSPSELGDCSRSLQSIVDAASDGTTVTVPACVFRETVTVRKPLTLLGQPGALRDV